jgi:hypothetical protein
LRRGLHLREARTTTNLSRSLWRWLGLQQGHHVHGGGQCMAGEWWWVLRLQKKGERSGVVPLPRGDEKAVKRAARMKRKRRLMPAAEG